MLIGETTPDKIAKTYGWAHEKMSPVLGLFVGKDYIDAIDIGRKLVLNGGVGHTGSYFTHEECRERLDYFEKQIPAGTLVHNEPSLHGSIGDLFNPGTVPRMSIPSSTSVGEATVTLEKLLAIKTYSRRHEHMLWVSQYDGIETIDSSTVSTPAAHPVVHVLQ